MKVGKWSPVRVEVTGGISGGRLRLVLATSDPTTGDLLDGTVSWQGEGLAGLAGKTVSLRFRLRDGSLYAYWLTD